MVLGQQVRERFEMMVILNGTFSVGTFFCISGLLVPFLTLKTLRNTKGKLNIPMMYFQRYMRFSFLNACNLVSNFSNLSFICFN